jgi:hypothetical protein
MKEHGNRRRLAGGCDAGEISSDGASMSSTRWLSKGSPYSPHALLDFDLLHHVPPS